MVRLIKQISFLSLTLLLLAVFMPRPVSAGFFDGAKGEACKTLNETNGQASTSSDDCGESGNGRVTAIIGTVLNLLSLAIGIAAVIMIVISGLKFVTSQGDSAGVSSAKNTLLYAVIGLVVVVLAQAIVQFVLKRTTGQPNKQFETQSIVRFV